MWQDKQVGEWVRYPPCALPTRKPMPAAATFTPKSTKRKGLRISGEGGDS